MAHRILIADDDRSSLVLLERTLAKLGFQVITATNGEEADRVLQGNNPPRLAILDWEMPGFTGPQICRRVRNRTDLNYVYVILLTAREGQAEFEHASAAGVDDFLTKPLNSAFLQHRLAVAVRVIESELQLEGKQLELAQVIQNLEALAEKRAMQLVHTERLATLGTLAAGVAHEINNPSTFISGNMKILKECWPLVDEALTRFMDHPEADQDRVGFIREEAPKIIDGALVGVDRIKNIINGLKNYSRKGNDQVAPFNVVQSLENALAICHNLLKYQIKVLKNLPTDPVVVQGDGQQIEQVFINLISNAVDAMQEQEAGTISISLTTENGQARVHLDDTGPGIPQQVLDEIWTPFFTTKEIGKGTGLGLSIVQRIIRNHEGEIEAGNRPEGGARFIIRLPLGVGAITRSNDIPVLKALEPEAQPV